MVRMSVSESNEDVIVLQEENDGFEEEDSMSHRGRLNSSSEFYSGPVEAENTADLVKIVKTHEQAKQDSSSKSSEIQQKEESVAMDTSGGSQQTKSALNESVNMEDAGRQTSNGQSGEEPMDTAPHVPEGVKGTTQKASPMREEENKGHNTVPVGEIKKVEAKSGTEEMKESGEEEEAGGDEEEGEEKEGAESGEEESGDEESDETSNESADESVSSSEESGQRSTSSKGSGKRKRALDGSTDSGRARAKYPKTGSRNDQSKDRKSPKKPKLCGEDNRLDFYFTDARYFQIKSGNEENVMLSKAKGVWATTSRNEQNINKAFRAGRNVILVFSVERSQRFQGFARVAAESSRDHSPVNWVLPAGLNARNLGGVFKLHWINRLELPFSMCAGLCNPWNENKPVKIARDGTELPPDVGRKLCSMFPADDGVDLAALEKKVRKLQESHPYEFKSPGAKRYSESRRSNGGAPPPRSAPERPRGGGAGKPPRRGRGPSRSPPGRRPPALTGSNMAPVAAVRQGPSGRSGGGGGGNRDWGGGQRRYSGGRDPPYNGYYEGYDRGGYGAGYPPYAMGGGFGYGSSSIPSIYDWPPYQPSPQPLMGVPTSRYGGYSYGPSSDANAPRSLVERPTSGRSKPPSAYSDPYRGTARSSRRSQSPPPPSLLSGVRRPAGRGDDRAVRGDDRAPTGRRRKESIRSNSGGRSPPQAYKSGSGGKKRPETPPRHRRQKERATRR